MSVDFNRENLEFNDDLEDEEVGDDEVAEDEEEGGSKRNPLRLIILVLFVLVLLCLLCFGVSNYLGGGILDRIPGIGGPGPAPTPAQDTPTPAPTDETTLPATEEATVIVVTDEAMAPTDEPQMPAEATAEPGEQPTVIVQPTTEPQPTEETAEQPTDEAVGEHDEDLPTPQPTATTVPVPGPTATTGPTVVITIAPDCSNNQPPVANAGGPYNAMRGKGQAFVTFDGSGSSDPDGTITSYEWDFGDNSAPGSGASVTHGYTSVGSYIATLTVTDNCGATAQDTADVTIVGPTPPASVTPGTPTATPGPGTPTATPAPPPQGTLGFCYRVQYGDTLVGIAWRFGVAWQDLAYVNNVPMHYFVIAGQGLFIPTGQITQGPNLYEVQPDDTLNSVAFQCGLTATYLAQVNGLNPGDSLTPGQRLMIPPWNYR